MPSVSIASRVLHLLYMGYSLSSGMQSRGKGGGRGQEKGGNDVGGIGLPDMSVTSTWTAFSRSVSADFRASSVMGVCAIIVGRGAASPLNKSQDDENYLWSYHRESVMGFFLSAAGWVDARTSITLQNVEKPVLRRSLPT